MTIIKLIFKGIFLYASMLFWVLFICGADSIMEQGCFGWFSLVAAIDIAIFKLFYHMNDLEVLSFDITLKQYKENETRRKAKCVSGTDKDAQRH